MNSAIQLMQIDLDSFGQFIQKLVREELEKYNNVNQGQENEKQFYTREETAKLLNVSLTTLFHWNNDGTLKNTKIGKRVYYSRNEVLTRLNP
ncbi:helix-turn-helix domain-containing protein [Chryseobacterium sp. MHB01]|uniref:helix-turn-helix domain-containing protein n=1 Tax=Chryseobacterium TaxID=59732 RepID=UPI0028651620|nr:MULTISPECIES: helix-turn-helix domain-containing protein [Chryseobacterium]MDR6489354.1 excisionase family DNA binding protein [Chryseobacterium vietnamense]MEA1850202.1 helix-turn-helix domain-containing protein [Chryseobacterium sp. MHB01]